MMILFINALKSKKKIEEKKVEDFVGSNVGLGYKLSFYMAKTYCKIRAFTNMAA